MTTSTILVTGATGQVGRRLVPRLLSWRPPAAPGAQPEQVRVLVRTQQAADDFRAAGAQAIVGDLTDAADRKRALDGVDVVVNSAATFRSPGVTDAEMNAVNRDAAVALARESAEGGVRRFVQISTNLVYGPGIGRPVREDDPLRAEIGGYPRSKREAEEMLEALREQTGFGVVTLRLTFVYGDGDPHIQNYLPRLTGRPAHAPLAMVHHADVAQAVLHAIHVPGIEGRAYNIAGDAVSTTYELHELIGLRSEPDPVAGVGGVDGDAANPAGSPIVADPWFGVPDTTRAFRELGFRPIYPTARAAWRDGAL
jgi:nucleoside-diphosphate-sugar epimerase